MAPGLLRIVGGGGSLPHPPCEAKQATAVACTIFHRGSPAAASPGGRVLLGVGTQAVAGSVRLSSLPRFLGGTLPRPGPRAAKLDPPPSRPPLQPHRSVQQSRH